MSKVDKKIPKVRMGTRANPFIATPDSVERPFLLAAIHEDEYVNFDFGKWYGDDHYYFENALFNPNLSHKEFRLLMYFFETAGDVGNIYETSTNGMLNVARHYGEDNAIFVKFPHTTGIGKEPYGYEFFSEDLECHPLLIDLEFMGMKLKQKELASMLYRLHDFGYLTVTDLISDNLQIPPEKGGKLVKRRAKLRLIRLTKAMIFKEVWHLWVPRTERQLLARVKELGIITKPLSVGK